MYMYIYIYIYMYIYMYIYFSFPSRLPYAGHVNGKCCGFHRSVGTTDIVNEKFYTSLCDDTSQRAADFLNRFRKSPCTQT